MKGFSSLNYPDFDLSVPSENVDSHSVVVTMNKKIDRSFANRKVNDFESAKDTGQNRLVEGHSPLRCLDRQP